MVTFGDEEILDLIEMPKDRTGRLPGMPRLRSKRGHREGFVLFAGPDGSRFKVVLRRSLDNPLDFSAILMVRVPGSNRWFRLRRYNGRSHWHRNRIEGDRFRECHIHTATERYQRIGYREDGYAEPTNRFGDYEGALRCLAQDAKLSMTSPGADDQMGLGLEEVT